MKKPTKNDFAYEYPNCGTDMPKYREALEEYVCYLEENIKLLNLCEYCNKEFATCKSNPEFGNGLGYDNVYSCDGFNRKHTLTKDCWCNPMVEDYSNKES